jgi:hypothetical protein
MSDNPEIKILDALKAKYDESFKMINLVFSDEQNAYIFEARPREIKDIKFQGLFSDKIIEDSYPNHFISHEIDEIMNDHISNLSNTYAYDSEITSNYSHKFGEKIISLKEFLEDEKMKKTIHIFLYFFDIPKSSNDELIKNLRSIANKVAEITHDKFGMWTGFWPAGFLEDQNFDDLNFGFNSVEMEDADNIMNKAQYLAKVISFDVVNQKMEEINEEDLFEIMGDYNFDKGYENKEF